MPSSSFAARVWSRSRESNAAIQKLVSPTNPRMLIGGILALPVRLDGESCPRCPSAGPKYKAAKRLPVFVINQVDSVLVRSKLGVPFDRRKNRFQWFLGPRLKTEEARAVS